jgi:hypothetical protein
MNDAAQIRRCIGAPRARHSNLRTSILPPPSARHPNSRISNRKPLRLETHLTHTKQTTDPRSNLENNAFFSDHCHPTRRRPQEISNREPLRRVRADESARRNDEHTLLTHTKQRADPHSNREKQPVFKSTCRGGPPVPPTDAPPGSRPFVRPSCRPSFLLPLSTRSPQFTGPNSKFPLPQKPKNTKIPPQSWFRLERTPAVYFHQLTRILNEPMFRLDEEGSLTRKRFGMTAQRELPGGLQSQFRVSGRGDSASQK